jgi:septal ring factor EnvC (AmiA/AmiB activator)
MRISVPRFRSRQSDIDNKNRQLNQSNREIDTLRSTLSYSTYKDDAIKKNISDNKSKLNSINKQISNLEHDLHILQESQTLKEHELEMIRESFLSLKEPMVINDIYSSVKNDYIDVTQNYTQGNDAINSVYTQNFYDNINMQNYVIRKKNSQRAANEEYKTTNEKEYYMNEQTTLFVNINFWLFTFFYVLLFILIIVLFFIQKSMSLYSKIGWIILLGIYPFIIVFIERIVMGVLRLCLDYIHTIVERS